MNQDLSPLFDCLQLCKVFAAHNRVSSITGLEKCQQLQDTDVLVAMLSCGHIVDRRKTTKYNWSFKIDKRDGMHQKQC